MKSTSLVTRMKFTVFIPKPGKVNNSSLLIRPFTSHEILNNNIWRNNYYKSNHSSYNRHSILIDSHMHSLQKRYVNDNSWASDRLKELGEKIEPGPEQTLTEATEELLHSPSPKVQQLIDQILSLNMIEVNQLVTSIQVAKRFTYSLLTINE